jgi:hypothetical protein
MSKCRGSAQGILFVCAALFGLFGLFACDRGDGGRSAGSGTPVTFSGTIWYEDREYDLDGFTGTELRPVRNAVVETVRESDGAVLASGATASDGEYSLEFTHTGTAGVYLRVKARTADGAVEVQDPDGNLYSMTSLVIDDSFSDGFEVDLAAEVGTAGGVFNILEVLREGADFVSGLTGGPPPRVTAVWQAGNCDGTYFDPAAAAIHLLGGCENDTDEYDDTVILHEYGHFVSDHFSKDDSPGGPHSLTDTAQDIRLAWSEGWGSFFAGAVRGDPVYVDTLGDGVQLVYEMEGITSPLASDLAALAVYTTNELAVAAVLWDVYDISLDEAFTRADGMDTVSAGMAPVWDVIANYLTCTACSITNVSMEDFWDGWFANGHGLPTEMETLAADRGIVFTADGFEPNDDPSSAFFCAALPCATDHTFSPALNQDYVGFDAVGGTGYTIETLALINGADTFVQVQDIAETPIGGFENDNASGITYSADCGRNPLTQQSTCPPNDETTLASKVVFTPAVSGTYYIRIGPSPAAPPSAGAYGGYRLRITSP